jgi:arylsulfatase
MGVASARGGTATVSVDGKEVARGRVERTIPIRITLDETLDVGEDCGTPVNLQYEVPFKFTGKIDKVTIELGKSGLAAGDEKKLEEMASTAARARE